MIHTVEMIANPRGNWATVRTDGDRRSIIGRFNSETAAKRYATRQQNEQQFFTA